MLVDTSGWFLLLDDSDVRHQNAVRVYKEALRKVTHSFIIDEFISLCNTRRRSRSAALQLVDHMLDDKRVEVVWIDEALTLQGLELLNSRQDKSWSLCDAVSFVIMHDQNLSHALTTDRHFQQAGFVGLLSS
jgi:predicted nucleic acid-binding protein